MRNVLILFLILSTALYARTEKTGTDSDGETYYLHLPSSYDENKTYQLLVAVHGMGGKAETALGMKNHVDKWDVILASPYFGPTGYQGGDGAKARMLTKLFKDLSSKYKLEDKMCLVGFSAGAQFTHRFTIANPNLVAACSSHSAGSWSKAQRGANSVPFVISCGGDDTTRLAGYRDFESSLKSAGFCFKSKIVPGVGHGTSPTVYDMTYELLQFIRNPLSLADAKRREDILEALKNKDTSAIKDLKEFKLDGTSDGWKMSKKMQSNSNETSQKYIDDYIAEHAINLKELGEKYTVETKIEKALQQTPSFRDLLKLNKRYDLSRYKGGPDLITIIEGESEIYYQGLLEKGEIETKSYLSLLNGFKGLKIHDIIMTDHDEKAKKDLQTILTETDSTLKKSNLKTFINNFKVGESVETAKVEYKKL